jgi:acetyl esterase/lipase
MNPILTVLLLWPTGAPGAKGQEPTDKPSLTVFLPDPAKASGTAVVVCPGGGYQTLATNHEGREVCQWLNSLGVAAFMLQYRLGPRYHHPAPLQDAQRALRIVRARAKEWKIDPQRIGIWGFSAGGHLASTAATHYDKGRPDRARRLPARFSDSRLPGHFAGAALFAQGLARQPAGQ